MSHGAELECPAEESDNAPEQDVRKADVRHVGQVASKQAKEHCYHVDRYGMNLRLGRGVAEVFEDSGLECC